MAEETAVTLKTKSEIVMRVRSRTGGCGGMRESVREGDASGSEEGEKVGKELDSVELGKEGESEKSLLNERVGVDVGGHLEMSTSVFSCS